MTTYIWAWADDEYNYIDEAESLSAIVREVLENCFSTNGSLTIDELDGKFLINMTTWEGRVQYAVNAEPNSVCNYLNEMAESVDRTDKFAIFSK